MDPKLLKHTSKFPYIEKKCLLYKFSRIIQVIHMFNIVIIWNSTIQ